MALFWSRNSRNSRNSGSKKRRMGTHSPKKRTKLFSDSSLRSKPLTFLLLICAASSMLSQPAYNQCVTTYRYKHQKNENRVYRSRYIGIALFHKPFPSSLHNVRKRPQLATAAGGAPRPPQSPQEHMPPGGKMSRKQRVFSQSCPCPK